MGAGTLYAKLDFVNSLHSRELIRRSSMSKVSTALTLPSSQKFDMGRWNDIFCHSEVMRARQMLVDSLIYTYTPMCFFIIERNYSLMWRHVIYWCSREREKPRNGNRLSQQFENRRIISRLLDNGKIPLKLYRSRWKAAQVCGWDYYIEYWYVLAVIELHIGAATKVEVKMDFLLLRAHRRRTSWITKKKTKANI